MARTALAEKKRLANGGDSFDVTCTIGTVHLGASGDAAPHVVAMQLIAEHDAQGTFSFPMADGRTQVVTVEFVGEDLVNDKAAWDDSI